ncbi:DUF7255 family protein [Nocardioides campestrisoli]|uniref:DUF7255 family protein n=1 Tax=Nocardioides campestrisoli TaxID=2736757 RepID=UPI001CD45F20|nr:hypothetical protein [Nocardioides campestrisoli]
MARGDCELAFCAAAAEDGIELTRAKVPWLNQRGHLGLPVGASAAVPVMEEIFSALGGIDVEQAGKRLTALPGDFVHLPTGVFIEVDESQHFTSYRLTTLALYPPATVLGYDLDEYRELCERWVPRSDRYRQAKAAIGFGSGGRQRQRAYHDALRDLVNPAMGHTLIRAAAPDRDGSAAYEAVRSRLRVACGV